MYGLILIILMCIVVPFQVQADVLWIQAPSANPEIPSIVDQVWPDYPLDSAYQVHDCSGGCSWLDHPVDYYILH